MKRMNRSRIYSSIKKGLKRLAKQLVSSPLSLNSTEEQSPRQDYGGGNKVINHPRLVRAKIVFKGENNILYCESPDTILQDCKISFSGSNSVIYLSKHRDNRPYHVNIYIQSESTVFIGRDVNFHKSRDHRADLSVSEGKHIIIGNDCLFSMDIWIRTSDGHAAYSISTKKRINSGRSILIGDHVWIGRDVSILKGSIIGSGSIIGARSVVTGKELPSNSSFAGIPAAVISKGIYFNKPDINSYTEEQLETIQDYDTDEWIYEKDGTTLSFEDIDRALSESKTSDSKLAYIQDHLASYNYKNRFFIAP